MDVLFVHVTYPLAEKIVTFYKSNIDHPSLISTQVKQVIDPESSYGGDDALADATDVKHTLKDLQTTPELLYLKNVWQYAIKYKKGKPQL